MGLSQFHIGDFASGLGSQSSLGFGCHVSPITKSNGNGCVAGHDPCICRGYGVIGLFLLSAGEGPDLLFRSSTGTKEGNVAAEKDRIFVNGCSADHLYDRGNNFGNIRLGVRNAC